MSFLGVSHLFDRKAAVKTLSAAHDLLSQNFVNPLDFAFKRLSVLSEELKSERFHREGLPVVLLSYETSLTGAKL